MAFDLEGFAISNGSACSSGTVKPSYVLTAMGFDAKHAGGALRISSGWATRKEDLEAFFAAWQKITARIAA
jgi:cysteine desulfurase